MKRYTIEEVMPVAHMLVKTLLPFCERIVIAGSIRREKPTVGDIEILFVPRIESRQAEFFTTEPVDLCAEKISAWLADGTLSKRPNAKGSFAWGPKNKLAIHNASGIPVDFFATTRSAWLVSLVIRTGGKETNLRLTAGAQAKNASLRAYGDGVTWSDGTHTVATSERHVFDLCGVEYIEPNERT